MYVNYMYTAGTANGDVLMGMRLGGNGNAKSYSRIPLTCTGHLSSQRIRQSTGK